MSKYVKYFLGEESIRDPMIETNIALQIINLQKNQIVEELKTIIKPDALDDWLKKPNPAFENKTPQEFLDKCDFFPLQQMLATMNWGGF